VDFFRPLFRPHKFSGSAPSALLRHTITIYSPWEGKVRENAVGLVQPSNAIRRCKKADHPPQIKCASSSRYPLAVKILIIIHTELKKDPGVPRLPNLKVCSAEKQRRRSVCPPDFSGSTTDTCAARRTPLVSRIPHLSLHHNPPRMKMQRWHPSPRSLH
jgi:hypothetical protein